MASARLPLTDWGFHPSASGGKGSARAAASSFSSLGSVTVFVLQGLGEPFIRVLEKAQVETAPLVLALAPGSRPPVLPVLAVAGPGRHEIAEALRREQGHPGPADPGAGQDVGLRAHGQAAAAVREARGRVPALPAGSRQVGQARAGHGPRPRIYSNARVSRIKGWRGPFPHGLLSRTAPVRPRRAAHGRPRRAASRRTS